MCFNSQINCQNLSHVSTHFVFIPKHRCIFGHHAYRLKHLCIHRLHVNTKEIPNSLLLTRKTQWSKKLSTSRFHCRCLSKSPDWNYPHADLDSLEVRYKAFTIRVWVLSAPLKELPNREPVATMDTQSVESPWLPPTDNYSCVTDTARHCTRSW